MQTREHVFEIELSGFGTVTARLCCITNAIYPIETHLLGLRGTVVSLRETFNWHQGLLLKGTVWHITISRSYLLAFTCRLEQSNQSLHKA